MVHCHAQASYSGLQESCGGPSRTPVREAQSSAHTSRRSWSVNLLPSFCLEAITALPANDPQEPGSPAIHLPTRERLRSMVSRTAFSMASQVELGSILSDDTTDKDRIAVSVTRGAGFGELSGRPRAEQAANPGPQLYNSIMAGLAWRYILHADLDAFFAAVEQRDNPELKGRPVVVGGPAESRGVVAAASYEARRYGIRSALPMRTAFQRCPDLVRVSPRFGRYREVSSQVMGLFRSLTPVVQPLSLDEAFLDISERVTPGRVEEVAQGLKARVRRTVGLVVTIGGGTSKTVAKIASQLAKPDGLMLIEPGEERAFLGPLDVGLLWGVGPKSAVLLREHGVTSLGHLAICDEAWLQQTFGVRGPELKRRAAGTDQERVMTHPKTRSVSAEVTMPNDVEDETSLVERVERLARRVGERLQSAGLKGKTVQVKLRLADFRTFTRQAALPAPTDDAEAILSVASKLLRQELGPGRRFRLVGVGVTVSEGAFQLSLFPLVEPNLREAEGG